MRWLTPTIASMLIATGLAACTPAKPDAQADASAQAESAAPLTVENATYRPPLGDGVIGVIYMTLKPGMDGRVVGMSSPNAASVEMHETVITDGQARMQKLDGIDLKAGEEVKLEQGGMHVMVFNPEPVEAGGTFPLILSLADGETLTVDCAIAQ